VSDPKSDERLRWLVPHAVFVTADEALNGWPGRCRRFGYGLGKSTVLSTKHEAGIAHTGLTTGHLAKHVCKTMEI
jgi:hypothetical protein